MRCRWSRSRGHVRFENVHFWLPAGRAGHQEHDPGGQAGQTIALVGPTGAGKTTIINLLTRFYEIQEGSITIDGDDIREMREGRPAPPAGAGAAGHLPVLRHGDGEHPLRAAGGHRRGVIQAAELADADHFIRQLPHGYQTLLSERASNLSQGQRQLLAIARAILADPAILILDEATSSVDTRTEARIQKSLLRLMQGRTSFVIAHRLSTIRDADKVVVINDGEIVEQGTHQELLEKRGFYHQLYMSQFKGQAI